MITQASLIINQPDSTMCPKIYEKLDSGQIYGWFKHPFHGWFKHPFQGCTNQIHTLNMVDSTMKRRKGMPWLVLITFCSWLYLTAKFLYHALCGHKHTKLRDKNPVCFGLGVCLFSVSFGLEWRQSLSIWTRLSSRDAKYRHDYLNIHSADAKLKQYFHNGSKICPSKSAKNEVRSYMRILFQYAVDCCKKGNVCSTKRLQVW